MFIIQELYVEDKNLAKVLRSLAGLVFDMGPPRPVNASRKGKRLLSKGGSAMELILNWFQEEGVTKFTTKNVNHILEEAGFTKQSGYNALMELTKAKRIKRTSTGHYTTRLARTRKAK